MPGLGLGLGDTAVNKPGKIPTVVGSASECGETDNKEDKPGKSGGEAGTGQGAGKVGPRSPGQAGEETDTLQQFNNLLLLLNNFR